MIGGSGSTPKRSDKQEFASFETMYFLTIGITIATVLLLVSHLLFHQLDPFFPMQTPTYYERPPPDRRSLTLDAVDTFVATFSARIRNRSIARAFENCFPSTVDTTVLFHQDHADDGGIPDTFIITGDVPSFLSK